MEEPRLFASTSLADSSVSPTERRWAILAHLGWLLLPILLALIVMQVQGKRSAWVKEQAKEAVNFQIFVTVATLVLHYVPFLHRLDWIPVVYCVVMSAVATFSLRRGEPYNYAATYDFLK